MAAEAIQVAVRVEDGIPKLLVKISPSTCAGFAAKNLGEVTVKRPGAPRGHVAVLHLSSAVPAGSVLISLKLSELLEVTSGDQVQIVHSDRVRRAARREPPQDPMVMRRGSWSDLPVPGQRVQAVQVPTSARQNWRESFGRPLQDSTQSLHARPGRPKEPVPQAADELGTEFSPLPKAIPRTSIQSPNQQKLSQKASNLGFATPSLPVTESYASPAAATASVPSASAPGTPQRCLMPAFAQAAHSQRGEPPKPGYPPVAQPQVVHPQMSQQQPFNPATRTVFKAPAHFVQPGSPGSASRTLNAVNPASAGFSRPMASTAPAPGRRPGTEACKEALGQVEVADWLPASMGSPVWKAAQQPPPSSPPALVPKAPSQSPTRTHSPSPSPPQMRPEGAQPKVPSPKLQPFPQPQSSPQGPLLRDGERAVRVRQSVPNLQPRRVHSQAELQRGTARHGAEIPSKISPSPKVALNKERQSLSPPPLRMPRAAPSASPTSASGEPSPSLGPPPGHAPSPSPTSASGEPPSPSLGPFHAPPGHAGHAGHAGQPNLEPEKATAAPARNGGVSWRNGTSAQRNSLTKETAADRSLSPAQPVVKPAVGPVEETSSPKADCSEQQPPPLVQRRDKVRPTALVHLPGAARSVSAKPRRTGTVRRPASQGLGHLQCEPCPACTQSAAAASVSCDWRRPQSTGGGSLERSELGPEITSEVRRWLLGLTEGLQCSHVVMDKALTVLSNFKLSSGCELEVLGGPLGAIVGGYNEADWLHQEIFSKSPADAVKESFELLGFGDVREGDWSSVMVEEVSLAYRRQCLRGHPSRGGPARGYLKLQVAMEVIRAFCGEAGPLTPEPAEEAMAAHFSTLARHVQQVVSKIPVPEWDTVDDAFLGVRNTFFDLSDSPSLQQWYKDTRGIRSCPASEHGDDDRTVCGDADVDEDDAMQTPEPSPRLFHEEENPQPSPAACNAAEPAKARTPLKSGASPYRPTPAAAPTCSTTYYAVPPPVGTTGQALAAEYHRRVQASRLQLSQAQVRQNIPPTYAPPDHLKAKQLAVTTPLQVSSPVLGSEVLPSLGSGAHATGECRPCAFFHKNRCVTGRTCLFCHLCDAGEKKRRLRLQKTKHISSVPFVLDDLALARELELTPSQAAQEADSLPVQRLEELNRALDEYILRQMCFKSEIVAEIARLHENSAYSILGVSPDASDAEIKKAYRVVAMQCHPDKGGDKAEFQELHEAYEKIMEQRRSSANLDGKSRKQREADSDEDPDTEEKEKEKEEKEETEEREEKPEENHQEKKEASSERAEAEESEEDGSDAQLLAKAAKAADEASHYAKTAAEFAHQAAEAAETARQGRDSGGAITLTKSIAHSAIVLTLTVVKAVRVVGYATMDVAAQCRLASRKFTEASCAESSTEAMGLGLEALNAALACAEVTETTAAELQVPEGLEASEAAERFVNAAVRASLAAASASNAAMSAAIAAVEGHRQCMQAVEAKTETAEEGPEPAEADKDDASEGKDQSQPSDHGSDDESVSPPEPRRHSKEDSAQAAIRRQVTQRNNNHKVLQRLNAEILTHQQNVREFLQANRQLIPAVSTEAKGRVHTLLSNYAREVGTELQERVQSDPSDLAEVLQSALKSTGLLAPFLQKQTLAIPICPKARVLKMAALYDLRMTVQVLEQEIFRPVQSLLEQVGKSPSYAPLAEIQDKVQKELARCIEEEHDGA
ncbi:DJA6 [Symbiodinium sp. CCMP2456]|nr:DJA6 [Symbiodinium sp. CCMP2456]